MKLITLAILLMLVAITSGLSQGIGGGIYTGPGGGSGGGPTNGITAEEATAIAQAAAQAATNALGSVAHSSTNDFMGTKFPAGGLPVDFSQPYLSFKPNVAYGQLQGVAYDKVNNFYYAIHNNSLEKFNSNFVCVATNLNIFNRATGTQLDAMEDGDFYNGHLVVPQMLYAASSGTNVSGLQIAVFDANMNLLATNDISTYGIQQSAAIADDPDSHIIYVLPEYLTTQIWKFDDTTFAFLGTVVLNPPFNPVPAAGVLAQGIAVKDGSLYVELNIVREANLMVVNPLTGENHLVSQLGNLYSGTQTEFEGLDNHGTNWLCAIWQYTNCWMFAYSPPPALAVDQFGTVQMGNSQTINAKVTGILQSSQGYNGVNDGLELDMPFDTYKGGTTFDHSENGFFMFHQNPNATGCYLTNGPSGNAFYIPSYTVGSLMMPDTNVLQYHTNLTVAYLVKTGNAGGQIEISKYNSSNLGQFFIQQYTPTTLRFLTILRQALGNGYFGMYRLDATVPAMNDNKWHYIVATFQASANSTTTNSFLYFDGVMVGMTNTPAGPLNFAPTNAPDYFRIGTSEGGSGVTDTAFDDVKVWNRALSALEIANQARAYGFNVPSDASTPSFTPILTPFTNTIVGYLKFTNNGTVYSIPVGTNAP